jgi:hypothetical protein
MANGKKKTGKQEARTKRSGKRLIDASLRQVKKANKNFSASGGKKYAKSTTQRETAVNYESEGRSRMATGKKTAKKKDLKVTPRSENKIRKAQESGYNKRKRL